MLLANYVTAWMSPKSARRTEDVKNGLQRHKRIDIRL